LPIDRASFSDHFDTPEKLAVHDGAVKRRSSRPRYFQEATRPACGRRLWKNDAR
jgi:hypothetical protein